MIKSRPGSPFQVILWVLSLQFLLSPLSSGVYGQDDVPAPDVHPGAVLDGGGLRAVRAAYVGEAFYNAAGGTETGGTTHIHNLSIALSIGPTEDGDGLSGYVQLLGTFGGSVGDLSGDAQGASNIEAPDALRLYEAWAERRWRRASLLLGLYDSNRDFQVIESAGIFINSSHGITPELAASGRNGPSIFPVTSLAARGTLQFGSTGYVRVAVLDGVPGNAGDESSFVHLSLGGDDGALLIGEVGIDALSGSSPLKVAIGGWSYTAWFEDAVHPEIVHSGAYGFYLLGETRLFESARGGQLNAFARAGYADERVHSMASSLAAGLASSGFFPARPEDQVGLGVAIVSQSQRLERASAVEGLHPRNEVALELTYQASPLHNLQIQPDIQYILHPGMSDTLSNCLLLAIRANLTF